MKENLNNFTNNVITENNNFLHAKLNHGLLKLDIKTKDVNSSLKELRRIMELLNAQEEDFVEDLFTFELRNMLSEEFVNNVAAVTEFKKYLSMEERYKILKEAIPATEELDFIQGKKLLRLDTNKIKLTVAKLLETISKTQTKHVIVHIKGLISDNERLMIVDNIHQKIPHAKIRAFHSEQDIENKILVETIFFGDYPEEA